MADFPRSVCVLGAGSWGSALAMVLARNISEVCLWGHDADAMAEMKAKRCNQRYLRGVSFAPNIDITADFEIVSAHRHFVVVVPSHAFRAVIEKLHRKLQRNKGARDAVVIWGSKGFDPDGGLLGDAVGEIFGDGVHAVISGPSFAAETAKQLPTALTLACRDARRAETLAAWFRTDATRVYSSDDMVGVQLGAAAKNVMAIAAGISDGLGFGANARAALITRGLAELTRLGIALGGRADTFTGLTGVGDLILTCTDDQSRNRRFGLGIGRGTAHEKLRADIGQEIEGINAARELHRLSGEYRVEMPITEQVYRVLHEGRAPKAAVRELLDRDAGSEMRNDIEN